MELHSHEKEAKHVFYKQKNALRLVCEEYAINWAPLNTHTIET